MQNSNNFEDNPIGLRNRAERMLQESPAGNYELAELSGEEIHRLIHELQVHQIELEIQNEELRRIQAEVEASRSKYAKLYDKYSKLYDFAPVGYCIIQERSIIEEANLTAADLLGIARQSLIGRPLTHFIAKDDQDTFYFHRAQVLKEVGVHTCEIKMLNYDNALFDAKFESIAVPGEDNTATKMRVTITDITERKLADRQLQASLKEKEVLLQEVHHRVKNNMQVIISLISLQCEKIEDKSICEEFNKTVDRINSMALVHMQLYNSRDFSKVDIHRYVNRIAENLFASRGVESARIALKIDQDDIVLGLDCAISCGLIINELLTNCLKHAFPANSTGEIRIGFQYLDDGQVEMRVSDDGIGLPENFDFRFSDNLGLQIVKALAEHQLRGSVLLDYTNGTKFLIRFKDQSHERIT